MFTMFDNAIIKGVLDEGDNGNEDDIISICPIKNETVKESTKNVTHPYFIV